jgi:Predicted membrane protein
MFNTDHLHPMIVHFPIALIIVGFLAEVVSLFFKSERCLSKTGFYLMILGTLAAIAAWSTGQLFTDHPSEGEILRVFVNHKTGGMITMIVMIIGSIFRIWLVVQKKEETRLKWIAFGFYLLGFAAVTFTGYMGGIMVYNFMLGQ